MQLTRYQQRSRRRRDGERGHRPGAPWAVLIAVVLAAACVLPASATASSADPDADPVELAASFAKTYTPSQAYARALYLLDSLVVQPAPTTPKTGKTAREPKDEHSGHGAGHEGGATEARREYHAAHFDATQAWGPLGTLLRLGIHSRNTLRQWISASRDKADTAANYIPEARASSSASTSGPTADALTRPEADEPLIYAASDGARPLQLWPWWEGRGDRAIAGPWTVPELAREQLAGAHLFPLTSPTGAPSSMSDATALFSRLGSSVLGSKRNRSKKEGRKAATGSGSASTSPGGKQTPLQKAQRRRREAVSLLEWVAFGQVAPDYSDLLKQTDGHASSSQAASSEKASHTGDEMQTAARNALANALSRNRTHFAFRTPHLTPAPEARPDPYEAHEKQARSSALWVLAEHSLWGTHAAPPHLPRAKAAYEVLAWTYGNATAHSRLGFLEGSGWGRIGGPGVGSGRAWGVGFVSKDEVETEAEEGLRQARALLHYELAARTPESDAQTQAHSTSTGDPLLSYSSRTSAQMALGFRYLSGIGTPMDCMKALDWYEIVARDAYARFLSGPPKGLILPYTHLRLSDVQGGAYGPGASAASSGYAASRPQVKAVLESRAGSGAVGEEARIRDLLEYYEYQAEPILKASGLKLDRGRMGRSGLGQRLVGAGGELGSGVRSTSLAAGYAVELARFYYGGSLWAAGESAGRVERDFRRAREYALRVASRVWPLDAGEVRRGGPSGPSPRSTSKTSAPGAKSTPTPVSGSRQLLEGEDLALPVKDEAILRANRAAAMLGWMYLRGEGVEQDLHRAWVWFARGSEMGDPDCHNGLGVMIRDGYGVKPNIEDAARYFTAAANPMNVSPDGLVNIGRIYFEMKDYGSASKSFKDAMHLMDPFESYLWQGKIDAALARAQAKASASSAGGTTTSGPSLQERCDSAVLNFKHAAERADWADPVFHRADRAWRRGDTQRALLGWMLAGELGYEAAQNNVAWILDRDKRRLQIPALDAGSGTGGGSLLTDRSFDRLALVQWTRSAGQENVDALVKMGDYYFRGIGTSTPGVPSYEKAVACYSAAADMSASALAYWNMGWMYETGLGVGQRDFHLAKRYYDMAWTTNKKEAYLAVVLSLVKLHVRAAWAALVHSDASALAMFDSYARGLDTSMPLTEAEEEQARKQAAAKLSRKQKKAQAQADPRAGGQGGGEAAIGADEPGAGDPYIPETYDRRPGAAAEQHQRQQQYAAHDDAGWLDDGTNAGQAGADDGYYDVDLFDDLEGILLISAVGFLFFLVWYRRRLQENNNNNNNANRPGGAVLNPAERARRERIEAAREEFRARGEDVIVPGQDGQGAARADGAGDAAPRAGAGGAVEEGGDGVPRRRRGFFGDGGEGEEGEGNPAWFANAM